MEAALPVSGLSCNVLVLNRLYMAVRVVSARRAFSLLLRNLAEVVSVEDAGYLSYDIHSWIELSQLKAQFERDNHDFVKTVRFEIAVPRIVRLLSYDRLPRQDVKLNAANSSLRSKYRTALKKVEKAVAAGNKAEATTLFAQAQSIVDTVADKGIFHKNKAARDKSRLSAKVKTLAAAA